MASSRREFLALAGGLVAVSSLPAASSSAFSDGSLFPQRGRFERLVLAMRRIEAGAEKPFSILHISDTHLAEIYPDDCDDLKNVSARRMRTFGGRQEEALRDSLDWAKKNVDYVLHTGDLIDFQSRANFDLVKKYYGDEVFGPVGNHEFYTYLPGEKHTWQESFKDPSRALLKEKWPRDARFSSKTVNGVNFVSLDDVFGTVTPEQIEQFHREVKKGLPVILCLHVPIHTERIWAMSQRYWRQHGRRYIDSATPPCAGDYKRQLEDSVTADFIKYLKSEKSLKGILAGHLHISVEDRFSPTAMEYVVGGNFMFHGQEILFS
jgi:3',5'-cyclic AMP phosphodiesterase CpdA